MPSFVSLRSFPDNSNKLGRLGAVGVTCASRDRNKGACNRLSAFRCEKQDDFGQRFGRNPSRKIGSRHVFAVRGRVNDRRQHRIYDERHTSPASARGKRRSDSQNTKAASDNN
jgi:hypothetical protein